MEQRSENIWLKAVFVFGIVIWVFWTLNTGLYVDENGLLTIYKGIYQGQRMFVDSWESLQTGGFLAWPLLSLYYKLLKPIFEAQGINIGLVLFMRISYVIVRGLIAIYLYLTIRKTEYEDGAFWGALFYFCFVVTWKDFSYKSYCEMAVMLIICFLIRFHHSRKNIYFVLTGLASCVAILAYPTMILFAFVICGLLIWKIYRNELEISSLVVFVVTCFACGACFLIYLQLTSGIPEAIAQLKYLGDQDYEASVFVRLGKMLISYMAFAVIAYIPVALIIFIRKYRNLDEHVEKGILSCYWIAFLLAVCLLKVDSVSNSRFVYALLILFFWFPYLIYEKAESNFTRIGAYSNSLNDGKEDLIIMFALSIATQLIWSISTNQDISVPGHMAVFSVVAVVVMLCAKGDMLWLVHGIIIAGLFFACFWVPESNGGYSDVLKERWIVTEGELKGIALLPKDYEANQAVYDLTTKYVTADDKLLVAFGSNSTGYLNSDAMQGTYSVYARTQKNTKLIDFYEVNIGNQADYVLIDTNNSKWTDFQNGETGKYILEKYRTIIDSEDGFELLGK